MRTAVVLVFVLGACLILRVKTSTAGEKRLEAQTGTTGLGHHFGVPKHQLLDPAVQTSGAEDLIKLKPQLNSVTTAVSRNLIDMASGLNPSEQVQASAAGGQQPMATADSTTAEASKSDTPGKLPWQLPEAEGDTDDAEPADAFPEGNIQAAADDTPHTYTRMQHLAGLLGLHVGRPIIAQAKSGSASSIVNLMKPAERDDGDSGSNTVTRHAPDLPAIPDAEASESLPKAELISSLDDMEASVDGGVAKIEGRRLTRKGLHRKPRKGSLAIASSPPTLGLPGVQAKGASPSTAAKDTKPVGKSAQMKTATGDSKAHFKLSAALTKGSPAKSKSSGSKSGLQQAPAEMKQQSQPEANSLATATHDDGSSDHVNHLEDADRPQKQTSAGKGDPAESAADHGNTADNDQTSKHDVQGESSEIRSPEQDRPAGESSDSWPHQEYHAPADLGDKVHNADEPDTTEESQDQNTQVDDGATAAAADEGTSNSNDPDKDSSESGWSSLWGNQAPMKPAHVIEVLPQTAEQAGGGRDGDEKAEDAQANLSSEKATVEAADLEAAGAQLPLANISWAPLGIGPEVSPGGCILLERAISPDELDKDFDPLDDLKSDLENIEAKRWEDMEYITRYMNWMYGLRHNYDVKWVDRLSGTTDMEQSRKMLYAMADNLECCCPWLLWLDRGMLFRMEDHEQSVEQWLHSHEKPGDSGAPFATPLLAEMVYGAEPLENPVLGVVSTAGDEGAHGHWEMVQAIKHPAITPSAMLLARTNATASFLETWTTALDTDLQPVLDPEYSSLLKEALNQIAYPRYLGDIWSLPFNEMGSPDSPIVSKLPETAEEQVAMLAKQAAGMLEKRRP